jgi:hypothetical protein
MYPPYILAIIGVYSLGPSLLARGGGIRVLHLTCSRWGLLWWRTSLVVVRRKVLAACQRMSGRPPSSPLLHPQSYKMMMISSGITHYPVGKKFEHTSTWPTSRLGGQQDRLVEEMADSDAVISFVTPSCILLCNLGPEPVRKP